LGPWETGQDIEQIRLMKREGQGGVSGKLNWSKGQKEKEIELLREK